MERKRIARTIFAILALGLAVTAFTSVPNTWLASWALVVLACGFVMAAWDPNWFPRDHDGTMIFLIMLVVLVVGSLVLGLTKGIQWWSLAVAAGSFIGYLASIMLGTAAELDLWLKR